MANSAKNDNGSQFFITLDRADELDKKHTLFGKVRTAVAARMLRARSCRGSHVYLLHLALASRRRLLATPFSTC
jgi:cyclophilin family peptidyl-prolyl cis-trans isomerase